MIVLLLVVSLSKSGLSLYNCVTCHQGFRCIIVQSIFWSQMIMDLDEDDERKETLLAQLNAIAARLTFAPHSPVQQTPHATDTAQPMVRPLVTYT